MHTATQDARRALQFSRSIHTKQFVWYVQYVYTVMYCIQIYIQYLT